MERGDKRFEWGDGKGETIVHVGDNNEIWHIVEHLL